MSALLQKRPKLARRNKTPLCARSRHMQRSKAACCDRLGIAVVVLVSFEERLSRIALKSAAHRDQAS